MRQNEKYMDELHPKSCTQDQLDLKGIGIIANREAIKENLIKVCNDSSSIIRTREHFNSYDNITKRESFLMGISNGVKLESVWWNNELKTLIIKK